MSLLYTAGRFQYFKDDGTFASGYRLYPFNSGTTTFRATYTDATRATANTFFTDGSGLKYLVLDARGEVQAWLDDGAYSFRITDSAGSNPKTVDGIQDQSKVATDALRTELAASTGANLIGIGDTTVGAKLGRILTLPDDFDAPTDGTTDATTAVLAALNSGDLVDGCGLTYKISAPMVVTTGVAPKLRNCVLDASTMPATTQAFVITVTGTQGTAVSLSADASTNAQSISVSSATTFSDDTWVWLASKTVWYAGSSTTYVEFMNRVSAKSGTTLTLHEQLRYGLATVGTAPTAAPLTLVEGVYFEDVTIKGEYFGSPASSGNYLSGGIYLDKCLSPVVKNVRTENCHYAGVVFFRCAFPLREGGYSRDARADGYSYGTGVFGGTIGAKVVSSDTYDVRHGFTIGDDDGISYGSSVEGCKFLACRDAGIDAHPQGDYLTSTGNTVSISTYCDGTGSKAGDGFSIQCPNFVSSGDTIINPARHGFLYQLLAHQGGMVNITGALVRMNNYNTSTGGAVTIQNSTTGSGAIAGVTVDGLTLRGAGGYGVFVEADTGNISGVTIGDIDASQFTSSSQGSVYIHAKSGKTIAKPTVRGGSYVSSGTRCIYLHNEGTMTDAVVADVSTESTTYAVSLISVAGASVSDIHKWTSTNVLETTGSTSVKRDGWFFGSAAWNPGSLVDGAGETTTVTVTGATVGMPARAAFSNDLQGMTLTAWVSAADTVSVRLQNESGGTLDLASGTLRAWAKPNWN